MKSKVLEFIKINFWSLLGMLTGLIVIIVGISFNAGGGYSVGDSLMRFGADFYTEMYQVTRETGSVINFKLASIVELIKLLFVFGGIIDICAFGKQLKSPQKAVVADNDAAPVTDTPVETATESETVNNSI